MADPRLEEAKQSQTTTGGEPRVSLWRRLKRWMRAHHLTLMTLPDTPHSIALGSAIGIFFGFTPLFGLKTLLSILGTWLCKGNKMAAFISVTLHDIMLPFWPAIFLWEYRMGMWVLYGRVPQRPGFRHVSLVDYMEWTTFLTVGRPLLVGSLFFALPAAIVVYFGLRGVLIRTHAKRRQDDVR